MRKYDVSVEILGQTVPVGTLWGEHVHDVAFQYLPSYLALPQAAPISICLPLQPEAFSPGQTRSFFEGLLPEGFTRRSVAAAMRADEGDYLAILYGLGKECMGAVRISDGEAPSDAGALRRGSPEDWAPAAGGVERASYERLSAEQVRALAAEGATKSAELVTKAHLSLAGASGKVGLYYDAPTDTWYLPKGDAPSTHIVKQSHVRLSRIVLNEQMCLRTAARCGIEVPKSFIINLGRGRDAEVLLATERYDRVFSENAAEIDGLPVPLRLHQEDFCQALGIPASGKYEGPDGRYMHSLFELLRRHAADPVEDQLRLWDLLVFDLLVGNTDGHIKNVSLLYAPDLRSVRLAPAYDIVSTTVYDSSTRQLAFRFGDAVSVDDLVPESFALAAKDIGLGVKMTSDRTQRMMDRFEAALHESAGELDACGFPGAFEMEKQILATGGFARF